MSKEKKRIWATGIFFSKQYQTAYTLSVEVPTIMSGKKIQNLLRRSFKDNRDELVRVILTKDFYSPMGWNADSPALLNKDKDKTCLWGEGEGVLDSWWKS